MFMSLACFLLLSIVLTVSLRWRNPPTSAFMLAAQAVAVMPQQAEKLKVKFGSAFFSDYPFPYCWLFLLEQVFPSYFMPHQM